MRSALKEPLLHFLVIALLLYALGEWAQRRATAAPIVISRQQIEQLQQQYRQQFGVAPTPAALARLIDDQVATEVLYREGIALGLDRDDVIVRRRIAQKMEFLLQDGSVGEAPSDAVLQDFYRQHQAEFATPPQVSFTHLYFVANAAAGSALTQLAGRDCGQRVAADTYGGRVRFDGVEPQTVRNEFGDTPIAAAVFTLPPQRWQGPLQSGYGWHLVCVSAQQRAAQPAFADVRAAVLAEYRRERQAGRYRETLAQLKRRYQIIVGEG